MIQLLSYDSEIVYQHNGKYQNRIYKSNNGLTMKTIKVLVTDGEI